MPKTEKGHTETTFARADAVAKLILENDKYLHGKRSKELCQLVMKEFGVEQNSAYSYIKIARADIKSLGKKDKEKAFRIANRRNELLWLKLKDIDPKTALETVKEYCKLHGLYEDVKIKSESINRNINYDNLTDKALQRLAAKEDPETVLSDPSSYKINDDKS